MNCPKCHTVLNVEGLSGVFACPHCGQKLSLGGPASAPPLATATVRSVASPPPRASVAITTEEPTTTVRRKKSTGVVAFLDLRFERYLTPLIIRIYWSITLVSAVVGLIGFCASWFGTMLPDEPRESRTRFEFRVPQNASAERISPETSKTTADILKFVKKCVMLFFAITAVVVSVLFVRIICESIIVLFDISTTLKAIDKRGKSLDQRTS